MLRSLSILGLMALVGCAGVIFPPAALMVPFLLYVVLRGEGVIRDALVFLLAGSMVLTYGFANLGLRLGGMPLPLTELLLAPLVLLILTSRKSLTGLGLPGALLTLFISITTLHLVFDFSEQGTLALRDFTTSLESLFLLVGYWAFRVYGLAWVDRVWRWSFLAVAAFALLLPWHTVIAANSPTVGLQQPVALFDLDVGIGPAIAAALFFVLLRIKGPLALLLVALCLAEIAIIQMRGLYLAMPVAILLALLASGRLRSGLPSRLVGGIAVATIALLFLAPYMPEGRVGKVTPTVFVEQIETLLGHKGAGATSFEDRSDWYSKAWEDQTKSLSHLVWGVGLGDDLAGGFAVSDAVLVRKPHNDYIEVFARFGLIGLVAWAAFLASILVPIWQGARSPRLTHNERTFLIWVIAASTIYLLISATQPLLAFPYGTVPLFMMLGMGLALSRSAQTRSEDAAVADGNLVSA